MTYTDRRAALSIFCFVCDCGDIMCFFPRSVPSGSVAAKHGITEFVCGVCPECLKTKSNAWALRAVYEAREHAQNMMITLTYDSYIRRRGHIVGEQVSDRHVDVEDVQKFFKRLRRALPDGVKIKYMCAAEYGKRTHRPHYHCIIFGYCFPDCIPYKKSKRGNPIYTSLMLTKIWGNGICTVDSKNVTAAVSRYCTKYIAKDAGAEDTFMTFSHGIGIEPLYREFLKSHDRTHYMIDGKLYTIPRKVWQLYLEQKYPFPYRIMSTKYVNKTEENLASGLYDHFRKLRKRYSYVRDNDPEYQRYIAFWKSRVDVYMKDRPSARERIELLPEDKYHFYKAQARFCMEKREQGIPYPVPRSRTWNSYAIWYEERYGERLPKAWRPYRICRCTSCHTTANDTERESWSKRVLEWLLCKVIISPSTPFEKALSLRKLLDD